MMPRSLGNQKPALGSPMRGDFELTVDNWTIGDILIFHSWTPALIKSYKNLKREFLSLTPRPSRCSFKKKVAGLPVFAQDKKTSSSILSAQDWIGLSIYSIISGYFPGSFKHIVHQNFQRGARQL